MTLKLQEMFNFLKVLSTLQEQNTDYSILDTSLQEIPGALRDATETCSEKLNDEGFSALSLVPYYFSAGCSNSSEQLFLKILKIRFPEQLPSVCFLSLSFLFLYFISFYALLIYFIFFIYPFLSFFCQSFPLRSFRFFFRFLFFLSLSFYFLSFPLSLDFHSSLLLNF